MTDLQQSFFKYIAPLAKEVLYRHTPVQWQDGFTGEQHTHYVDFSITYPDNTSEHVEVLPASQQMPLTKYLYAQNALENWRMISKEELQVVEESDCNTPQWW